MQTMRSESDSLLPGSRAILVVDNVGLRRQEYRVLSQAGYRVFEAGTDTEAIEVLAAEQKRLFLLIVDVASPAVNGMMLCQRILEGYPAVRLLLAVPHRMVLNSKLIAIGAISLLSMPFSHEDLLHTVANVLGHTTA